MDRPWVRCAACALALALALTAAGCRTVADPPPAPVPVTGSPGSSSDTVDPGNPQPNTPTTSRWGPFDEGQIHGPTPATAVPPAP